jgi:hypothetical protein
MSFEDMQALASGSAPAAEPEPAPWEEPPVSNWSPIAESNAADAPVSNESYASASVPFGAPEEEESTFSLDNQPVPEDLPFASESSFDAQPADEPPPIVPAPEEEPAWSPVAAAEATAEQAEPVVPPAALAPASPSLPIARGELSDDQVDRIARRVVELMSDQVVRNIAWEVIPDLAEMVVKERIRQLESEA